MSFLVFFLQSLTLLTARVDWINDLVEVPVFAQLEPYRYLPEARLYIDDKWIENAYVIYERNGVEWTFISTVNTSYVRRYSIKYEAKFPNHNVSSIHTIVFDVVDKVPPEIISIPEKRIAIGEKLPDFQQGVLVKDNYYATELMKIYVDTTRILIQKVGVYVVTYTVTDPSGNSTIREVNFEIVDLIAPVITQTKEIILNVGSAFDYKLFFTTKDNVDLVLNVWVDLGSVDFHALGVYPITLYAKDLSHNIASFDTSITIKDLVAPEIHLKTKPPAIPVFTVIDRILLESYVLYVTDNVDTISTRDLIITHEIESHVLGTYKVYYQLTDSSGNQTMKSILIEVSDLEKPVIKLIEPLVFDVFSPMPFWNLYFEFSDNFTSEDQLIYKITTSPQLHTVGKYPITVELTDSSKNKTIYQGYVEVIDRIPPEITQLNDIIITTFERKDIKHYFAFSDQYDKASQLIYSLDDHDVLYDKIGIYTAKVMVKDLSHNQTVLEVDIMVIDMFEPILELKQVNYTHWIGSEAPSLISFIKEVRDNYDDLSLEDVIVLTDMSWERLGKYQVIYQLSDHSMNQTEVILTILIDDNIPPTITFSDLSITLGDQVNLMEGVKIEDNVNIDNITFFPKQPSFDNPGTYIITYIVRDTRGNYVIQERTITVYPSSNDIKILSYLPVAILTLICLSAFYILYKKG
jgi:hypothetical protein